MVSIENKIDTFFQENEKSVTSIIDGSDEYLDLILSITKPLDQLAKKFEKLNEDLYQSIKIIPDEKLKSEIMPKLRDLNKSCITLIGAIRTSFLYRDVRSALKNYTRQYDFFKEIFHDTHHFRNSNDAEFDNLLRELNDL